MPRPRTLPLDAIGLGLAAGFALAVAAGALATFGEDGDDGAAPTQVDLSVEVGPALELASADGLRRTAVVEAVEKVAPAVVSITTEVPAQDPFYRLSRGTRSSEGSGVVIAADGIVLTNAHVVEGASRIAATFPDGRSFDADMVGIAPELDLAVLRLRGAKGLVAVPRGTSADLMLGEPVIAIGNPFGLGHTVTTGVISATSRPLATDERVYQDFIQTDASINPGNSGGPLLNVHGQLIGINTAIRADAQNIGFAIPADRALKVARDLVDFGTVQLPWLGVDLSDVVLEGRSTRVTAPRIDRVHKGTAAEAAGIVAGDIIVAVDGRGVQGRSDLNAYLSAYSPDREVELELLHEGLGRRVKLRTARVSDEVIDQSLSAVLGVRVSALGPNTVGLRIDRLDGRGASAQRGLRAGDIIMAINGETVSTPEDLRAAIGQAKSGHRATALVTIRRGDYLARVNLPI